MYIRYYHFRRHFNGINYFELFPGARDAEPLGGVTVALDKDTGKIGMAVCSHRDFYNRKKGREKSYARLKVACHQNVDACAPCMKFVDEQEAVIGIVLRVLKSQNSTTPLKALRVLFE